ncbi:MAG: radical SAM family heme chaperone HemW [Alphaproteobacteria bacterium]
MSTPLTLSPFAIYVHWPWCLHKCPYCDFNVHVTDIIPEKAYIDCLIKDLEWQKQYVSKRILTSIFIGGGTPSLMGAEQVERLLDAIRERFHVSSALEVTLETNPYPLPDFLAYTRAGVNRFSLGVQSLGDADLLFLGRKHTAAQAHTAITQAMQACNNVNLDIIYGTPHQTIDSLQESLQSVLDYAPTHISAYQLTIEPNSAFYSQVRRKLWLPAPPDQQTAAFECVRETLTQAGYLNYEISNFARTPQSICAYNQHVWDYEPYLGIGAGAHGRIAHNNTLYATTCWKQPRTYMQHTTAGRTPFSELTPLSPTEALQEAVLMGLRSLKGVSLSRLPKRPQITSGKAVFSWPQALRLVGDGFLELTPTHLRLTSKGWPVLDEILTFLL